jgi:hypothetical protein
MCNAFSCLIGRDRKVYWKAGIDSHSALVEHFRLDDTRPPLEAAFVKVELTPEDGYLHPEGRWTPHVDQTETPHWWSDRMLMLALPALDSWKEEVYSKMKLEEARDPVKPWEVEAKAGPEELALLREWASVGDSVGDSVGASVGASVSDSVGASVWVSVWAYTGSLWAYTGRGRAPGSLWAYTGSLWAYTGSLFPGIKEWRYTEGIKVKGYPFESGAELWRRGLVPVKVGKKWRLMHPVKGGKAATLWEGEVKGGGAK